MSLTAENSQVDWGVFFSPIQTQLRGVLADAGAEHMAHELAVATRYVGEHVVARCVAGQVPGVAQPMRFWDWGEYEVLMFGQCEDSPEDIQEFLDELKQTWQSALSEDAAMDLINAAFTAWYAALPASVSAPDDAATLCIRIEDIGVFYVVHKSRKDALVARMQAEVAI